MDLIYLDNNADTRIDERVVEAMAGYQREGFGNPASQHQAGRRAQRVLDQCRQDIARMLGLRFDGAHPDRLLLTSGGTESNNLAILGLAGRHAGRVLVSAIEHPSVLQPAGELVRRGFDVRAIPVSSRGVVDVDALRKLITADTLLVSVMYGNHETGVLQPVREIAAICREANIAFHVDAVQAVGKAAVDFAELGCSTLSFSGHKFHGPAGVGGLAVAAGAPLQPMLFGGFQQASLRPGTESVVLAVGLCKALQLYYEEAQSRTARIESLRDRFEARLLEGDADIVINGGDAPRLPHVSNVALVGLDRQALFLSLDTAGVACSTGSACASGSTDPSPVLRAMGLADELISGALRFSLSARTSAADIDKSTRRILLAAGHLRAAKERRKSPLPSRGASLKTI